MRNARICLSARLSPPPFTVARLPSIASGALPRFRAVTLPRSLASAHAQVKLGGRLDTATSHLPCHKLQTQRPLSASRKPVPHLLLCARRVRELCEACASRALSLDAYVLGKVCALATPLPPPCVSVKQLDSAAALRPVPSLARHQISSAASSQWHRPCSEASERSGYQISHVEGN